jgi:hypothetical protein
VGAGPPNAFVFSIMEDGNMPEMTIKLSDIRLGLETMIGTMQRMVDTLNVMESEHGDLSVTFDSQPGCDKKEAPPWHHD